MIFKTLLFLGYCFVCIAPIAAQDDDSKENSTAEASQEIANDYETIKLKGWTLLLNKQLKADKPKLTAAMLKLMGPQLQRVVDAVPTPALKHLKTVPIWLNPPYENIQPTAQYHASANWLKKNGRLQEMARSIEITNVDKFDFENTRMPYLLLHELSHAYHDQVLGFQNTKIREAFEAAETSGGYDDVDRFDGRKIIKDKAYAMSNHKEYFAESSEAFFGKNDFFPFNREELTKHDPNMIDVLKEAWGVKDEDKKWKSLFDGKTLENWEEIQFGGEGEIEITNGAIHMESGDPLTGIRVVEDLPLPKTNYEIAFEGIKYEGDDFFAALTFPVADSFCTLVVGGWGGTLVGLSNLNDEDASENDTNLRRKFEADQWYRIRVRVVPDKITAWIDDEKLIDESIKGVKVSIRNDVIATTPLGITSFMTVSGIRNIRILSLEESDGLKESQTP